MPRPSNRKQRRAEIVSGLEAVMAREGYEAASITAIANAAGLASGLVHYHFQSKLEILLELIATLEARLEDRLQPALARAGSPRERLEAWIDAHLALQGDPSALACWVAIGAEAIRLPEVREAYHGVLERRHALLREELREALSAQGRPTRDARALAAALSALIEGTFQIAAAAPELVPRGSAARSARRALAGLLGTHEGEPLG